MTRLKIRQRSVQRRLHPESRDEGEMRSFCGERGLLFEALKGT